MSDSHNGELVAAPVLGSRAFFLDLADRVVKTFVQNLALFLVGGATLLSLSWTQALSSAGLAALVSVLLAVITSTQVTSGNAWLDVLDRAGRTFAGTLVGAIPAVGGFGDVDWNQAFTLAATAAVLSVLTSTLTLNLGATRGLPSTAPVIPPALPVIDPTGDVTEFRGE